MFFKTLSLGFFLFLTSVCSATESNVEEQNLTAVEKPREVSQPAEKVGLIGSFEIRPSWTSKQGEVHTENTAELGYQFHPQLALSYTQWFNTNLFAPPSKETKGVGLSANEGFIRVKSEDLLSAGNSSFSYIGRVYLPTWKDKRDAGLITYVRNYFKVALKLNRVVSVDYSAVPTFFAFRSAGSVTPLDGPTANPWYEGMSVFNADIKISEKFTFSFPITLHITRYRDYQTDAKLNNRWGYNLWVWPELDYAISPNSTLGLAFYSDNLVRDNLSAFSLQSGLESGVAQLLWSLEL